MTPKNCPLCGCQPRVSQAGEMVMIICDNDSARHDIVITDEAGAEVARWRDPIHSYGNDMEEAVQRWNTLDDSPMDNSDFSLD